MIAHAALERASAILLASGDIDVAAVGAAIASIVRGADPVIALGLRRRPGQRSIATAARERRRDELIGALDRRHCKRLTCAAAAAQILAWQDEYARGRALLCDLRDGVQSTDHGQRPRAFLLEIARLPAKLPARDRLQRIVARARGFSQHPTSPNLSATQEDFYAGKEDFRSAGDDADHQ